MKILVLQVKCIRATEYAIFSQKILIVRLNLLGNSPSHAHRLRRSEGIISRDQTDLNINSIKKKRINNKIIYITKSLCLTISNEYDVDSQRYPNKCRKIHFRPIYFFFLLWDVNHDYQCRKHGLYSQFSIYVTQSIGVEFFFFAFCLFQRSVHFATKFFQVRENFPLTLSKFRC